MNSTTAGTTAIKQVDVLVVGSGAAAFTAAITARKQGLEVLMVEKDAVYGGTSCFSGGVMWIPGNRHSASLGPDSLKQARTYIAQEAGEYFDAERVDAFLANGPEMIDFLERETELECYPFSYPDYHPSYPGHATVRSIGTKDYEAWRLGKYRKLLRQGLTQTNFMGLAVGSNVEMKQLMSAGRSLKGLAFVLRKFGGVFRDVLRYGKPDPVTRGRALIARLSRSAFDCGIELWLNAPAKELVFVDGRVEGAEVQTQQGRVRVMARKGVVLASGGFPHDAARTAKVYPHKAAGREHRSLANPSNTGDGARLAESAGGWVDTAVQQPSAWMPISVIPYYQGPKSLWPHIVDRQKPGFIAVTSEGKRFFDEAAPYHDFVPAMVKACEHLPQTFCYLICDHRAIRRYGLGFVKPAPVPNGQHVRSGYILRGETLSDLAQQAGIDAAQFERTVARFNEHAHKGVDPEFGRGGNIYDHSQGDPDHKPNPNIAPLDVGPFYALKLVPGDIGNFAGIRTDGNARVVAQDGAPIPGLYAAGNDALSFVSGGYAGAGGTLGPGMTLGYIAGKHLAAAETTAQPVQSMKKGSHG
ncbi:FAD-dependent oxidoreductase [Noviherbaspirillum sedimenti]|uniref:FAD-binding protein n=1 Tax=Noviherbaspirillum sedimenti TaxID=2320865 RepID=A0A3A3G4C5_9BURK|nr:FAD-dependent oxidoreductase [Noviherbaspirillum sedimenti]RJG03337.1 FAD-binding protein [Noviherbaspirillum sedimenti]